MPLTRKHFVAAATLGASAAALSTRRDAIAADASAQVTPAHFHILTQHEYDRRLMMDTLMVKKPHKQVFQASTSMLVAPGIASIYIHMQNSLNAHEFSFGYGPGSLATLAVLMGPSIVLALNDSMWSKYGFGDAFKLSATNVYYKASSNLKGGSSPDDPGSYYQDWSAQAVMHRGGKFMVCHNAMTFVSSVIGSKTGTAPATVLADFERNVLPGFQVVPAGVGAVQLAQEHGWTLFAIT